MKLLDARSLPGNAQEALRRRAVAAVRGGMTHAEVAMVLGVARGTVTRWYGVFKEKGEGGLAKRQRGRPPEPRLKGHQAATIVRLISDRCPEQLKLPFVLWTREAVRDLITQRYGIELSLSTVGRYLRRWGFTPQKPARRAFERSDEAVRQWLEVEYPAIQRQAKREGAEIHWADEMGARSYHQAGRSWGLRGKTPVVPGTGQRFRCNVISSITNRGTLRFRVFKGRFTGKLFIDFLRRLTKSAHRPVFLIVDRHPVHRSRAVARWVDDNCDKIRLFFLPPYSPDLNPDEFLNNDLKANALGRRRPRDRAELVADLRSYLRSTQRRPYVVQRYFWASSVRYAA